MDIRTICCTHLYSLIVTILNWQTYRLSHIFMHENRSALLNCVGVLFVCDILAHALVHVDSTSLQRIDTLRILNRCSLILHVTRMAPCVDEWVLLLLHWCGCAVVSSLLILMWSNVGVRQSLENIRGIRVSLISIEWTKCWLKAERYLSTWPWSETKDSKVCRITTYTVTSYCFVFGRVLSALLPVKT